MKIIDITKENETEIASKYLDFDFWVYDLILSKDKNIKHIKRLHFITNNNHGVLLCNIFDDEYITRIAFINEQSIEINILDGYFDEIIEQAKGKTSCLNINSTNKSLIRYFYSKYDVNIDCHCYVLEYKRSNYIKKALKNIEIIKKPFEEKYMDEYLSLLDEAFNHFCENNSFQNNKKYYSSLFSRNSINNRFAAFWIESKLIGVYYITDKRMIHTIAVHPQFQNRGLGTDLLNDALDYILKIMNENECRLRVVEENKDVLEFYKKNNFLLIGECVEATLKR